MSCGRYAPVRSNASPAKSARRWRRAPFYWKWRIEMRAQITSIAVSLSLLGCAQQPPASTPVPTTASASQGPPSTDIYLYKLSRRLPFGRRLINITNRPGYDNQPSWDGSAIYYTVQDAGQYDIYRYQ